MEGKKTGEGGGRGGKGKQRDGYRATQRFLLPDSIYLGLRGGGFGQRARCIGCFGGGGWAGEGGGKGRGGVGKGEEIGGGTSEGGAEFFYKIFF